MARLEHVIARNVIELREEHGATQASLAAEMRRNGFTWATNRVTQIETLRRPLSLLEVVGLAAVFSVPVTRLLNGDDDIEMPNGSTVPLGDVHLALVGVGWSKGRDADAELDEQGTTQNDDLRKIAKRVGVSPEEVDAAASRLYGRSLFAERDLRAEDMTDLAPRTARTKRGHVTRKLVEEIRAEVHRLSEQLQDQRSEHLQDGGDDNG